MPLPTRPKQYCDPASLVFSLFALCRFEADEELSAIISEMWNADENRLQPGDDYELDLQVGQGSCKE